MRGNYMIVYQFYLYDIEITIYFFEFLAAYLAQVIHNYYSEYTDILENIVKIIDVSVVMLNNLIDSSIQYNTMDISSILGNVIYSSKKLAQIYYECSSMENKLCQSIVNQPDMY